MSSLPLTHASYMARRHFGSLNGLRCCAILPVIWHHSYSDPGLRVLKMGFIGVDLFFVISGFLIGTLLLREKRDTGTIRLRSFYARRVLRIVPVNFAILFALAALLLIFKPGAPGTVAFLDLLPVYLLYVANWSLVHAPNLSVLWSLAAEEQFYLLWPPLEKYLRERLIWLVLAVLLGLNQLINFGVFDGFFVWLYGTPDATGLSILDTTFTPIILGVCLAQGLHAEASFKRLAPVLGHWLTPLLSVAGLLALLQFSPADISGLPRLFIHVLMAVLVGSVSIREDNSLRPFLANPVPEFIGSISYGMYLYHMFALHAARAVSARLGLGSELMLFVICAAITIFVSWLSFRYFETRFLSLKSRFAPGRAPA